MAISLKEPVQGGRISLRPNSGERPVNPELIDEKVDAVTYALGDQIPSEQVRLSFWQGYEGRLREQAAVQESIRDRRARQDLINEVSRAAAADGRPITTEESDYIMLVSRETVQTNPATIFEKLYTRRLVDDILNSPDNPEIEEALAVTAPEEVEEVRSAEEDFLTKQQIAMTILQEVKSRADSAPVHGKAWAFIKGFIPFYSWAQQRDRIKQGGSLLLGQNVEDQMRTLYLGSVDDFGPRLRAAVAGIEQENILEALRFASAAVSYSGSDALWDNVFTGFDAVDVATLGAAAGARALVRAGKLVNTARSTARATSVPGSTTRVARQVLSGNINGAAQTSSLQRLQAGTTVQTSFARYANAGTAPTPHQNLRMLMASGQGILDPQAYTRNIGSLSNERASRLVDVLTKNEQLLVSTMTDISHIGRISEDAAKRGFALAEVEFRRTYRNLEDAIIDVRGIRESEEVFGGVDHIEVLLGKKDATGFTSQVTAENHAKKMYRLPDGGYSIIQEGENYFIRMVKTIDETDPRLADLRIGTDNVAPVNLANTVLGVLRSASYLVSKENADWRKMATYGANAVLHRLAEVASVFPKLGKNEAQRLRTVLDDERIRTQSGQAPHRTVGEFEQAYQSRFQTLPTDNEIAAWATYRQMADASWLIDNLSVLRDKARLGAEQMSVGFSRGSQSEKGKELWQFVNSDFFEGRFVQSLPSTQEAYTVGWINPDNGRWKFGVSDRMLPADRKSVLDIVASGDYRIIQVVDPRSAVLKGMMDPQNKLIKGEPIEFLLVKTVKTKPLNFAQVEYSADLPFHSTDGFFIKQPRSHKTGFGRRVVDGDTVVQRAFSNAEGRELVRFYEEARQMVEAALASPNPNLSHVTQFVQAHLPFASARDFIKHFRGAPGAPDDAPFDLHTPFVLTAAGQKSSAVRTYDSIWGQKVVDLDISSHNLQNFINQNVGTNRSGTQQNPIVNTTAGPTIDPYVVISRSAERLARARFYDDYVHRSIEDWIHQFADTLNVSPEVLRANPMRFFQDPKEFWRKDYQDIALLAAAKNSRRAILALLGQDSQEIKTLKYFRQKVVDSIYKAHGKKGSNMVELWSMNHKTDPVGFLRTAVFHFRLGLFNVAQFPLQASAVVHAAAIDGNPLRAVQANFAYWGMRMRGLSEVSPKSQGALTQKISSALGVSAADLDEMYDAWRRSGMGIVSGEYGALDDYLNPKMFFGQGKGKKFLDVGQFFFKEGNSYHRGVSFATAYLRWRQTNPKARLDNQALKQIVDRADLMYLNMARDSNASWQRGLPSISSTFFAYHARMTEQLLGFRLTPAEKLRVMGAYSVMWGVPVGVGGAALGAFWPVGDSVQQAMQEQGIDADANIVMKVLTEGVADLVVEWAAGEDYNVSERLGPNGLSWLRDIVDGNALEALQGAPGSWIGDMYASLDPFAAGLLSVFDDQPGFFDIQDSDYLDVARNITSVNNLVKAYQIINLEGWRNRQDSILKESEGADLFAAMAAAVGMQPDQITEAYLQIRSNKSHDEMKRAVEKEVLLEFERALMAAKQGEREQSLAFFKRAHVRMQAADFTPLERAEVMKRAFRVNREMILDVGEDFVLRDPEVRLKRHMESMEE